MRELTIQIEKIEALRAATIAITGQSPEQKAIKAMLDWARPKGLLNQPFRFFGYDNCKPHPHHTYTTWLTVERHVQPSGIVGITEFPGGVFAVMEVRGVEQISTSWEQLAQWCKDSEYEFVDHPGLEEYLDVLDDHPLSEWRFKLCLPIKPR